ncbi:MAG TPA: thiamine phosphate synthase [Magnetovibrio sp.]
MHSVAKLAAGLNWHRFKPAALPSFYLMTDDTRLKNPLVDILALLKRLPHGGVLVLRHRDLAQLTTLAQVLVPIAHRLKLKVLLAGDVRLALRLKCDGVHLSQSRVRRGRLRIRALPPGFMVTAAAHDGFSIQRAFQSGADGVMLSPVFPTASHPRAKALGLLRFMSLANGSPRPIIALGGVTAETVKRLALGQTSGVAAIGAWQE